MPLRRRGYTDRREDSIGATNLPDGAIQKLRLQLGSLQRQLWDAHRQMEHVRRLLPKDVVVRRASKDVKAALHGAYLAARELQDAYPSLPPLFSSGEPPSNEVVRNRSGRGDAQHD